MSRPSSRPAMSGLAETLDRLITLELPKNGRRLLASHVASRGVTPDGVGELYRTARRRFGAPLADGAAAAFLHRTRPGDRLVITTGLVAPGIPRGETDGPAGAVALARAMILGRRVSVVLITEAEAGPVLEGAVEALAASEGDGALWRKQLRVLTFPSDLEVASDRARHLWRELQPAALVSVEKLGPNAQGIIHNMAGQDVTTTQARSDLFFPLAKRTRALTIGIGDRGNEIGLGGLLPKPGRCACPCGGSFACIVRAEIPVVASSSNWGAYGVTAALAARLKDRRLLHRPGSEARMLRRMVRAGAVDGITRRRAPTVDGCDLALQTALVGMLGALVG
ncbi:MAG: glutamate cyclase domain-containing protein [Candidatus Methylomirabilota bacterium]